MVSVILLLYIHSVVVQFLQFNTKAGSIDRTPAFRI